MMSSKIKNEIIEWIKIIATAIVLSLIITQFVKPTLVKGSSMYPTLKEDDYLIVNRIAYKIGEPEIGDIIVFHTDLPGENGQQKDLVKRVIATEGDHIKIEDSNVYVNEVKIDETYINEGLTEGYVDEVIPEGKVFTMGDNREASLDSRYDEVGLVEEDSILGKVMFRLYPFNKIGTLE